VTGPEDAGVTEAIGHLQAAFLELIAAARVSLDAIERAIRADPPPPSRSGDSADVTGRGAGSGPASPGVEHIRVS
jgi:hypothetical protein